MKATVLAVGRIRPPFDAAEGHYLKLARPRQRIEVAEVKDDAALLRRAGDAADRGGRLIALDLTGRTMGSEGWAGWLDRRRHEGRDLWFLIGGPEGLPAELAARAEDRLSLGPQTMAHQLARIVLLEQLFRAGKIIAGERYHL